MTGATGFGFLGFFFSRLLRSWPLGIRFSWTVHIGMLSAIIRLPSSRCLSTWPQGGALLAALAARGAADGGRVEEHLGRGARRAR
jgi:hypothetical protein